MSLSFLVGINKPELGKAQHEGGVAPLPRRVSLRDLPLLFLYHVLVSRLERDLFGAEPFDPFSCAAGDFPPDIQSKLDEMQVTIQPIGPCLVFSL